MLTRKRSGFTIIELLTVIAIIAILAAIIFPVMSATRKKARETQCISNMREVFTAVKLFQQDEHRYPEYIAGPYDPMNPQPLDKSTGLVGGRLVSLYPEYIKSTSALHCPDTIVGGDGREYTPTDIVDDPMFDQLAALGITGTIRSAAGMDGKSYYKLYAYSSYDYQKPPRSALGEAHYSTIWSNGDISTTPGIDRQLRWKNPPEDTVITWCTFHRDMDGSGVPSNGSLDMVLFLDGRVKRMPSATFTNWVDAWKTSPGL